MKNIASNRVLTGLLVAASALLVACAATGVKVSDEQVAALKPGETTETQVLAAFGAPTMRMRMPDGTVSLIYSYAEAQVRPATLIPFLGPFVGGADSRSSSVTLMFSPEGKLLNTSSYSSVYGTSMGPASGAKPAPTDQPRQ